MDYAGCSMMTAARQQGVPPAPVLLQSSFNLKIKPDIGNPTRILLEAPVTIKS